MTETTYTTEDLGIGARMLCVFRTPAATFAAMASSQSLRDWLIPTLIMAAATVASAIAILPVAGKVTDDIMSQQMTAEQHQALESMGQDPQAMMESMRQAAQIMGAIGAAFLPFISLFIVGALLLLLSNFVLGGNATYSQMLGVTAYSSLVGLIQLAIATPWIISSGELEVYTGLGILLSDPPTTFLALVVAGIDFFSLWQVYIMAIGMAVLTGLDPRRCLIALAVTWGVFVVGKAALTVAYLGFTDLAAGVV
mgnify:CR=1 FL=1